jgi:pimeloyl-ACP methyl ester carboxylesterase
MDGADRTGCDGLPVVVINGLGAPQLLAAAYAYSLRARGFRTFAITPSFLGLGDIRGAARRVDAEVHRVLEETGVAKVKLVGMSLGGLIGLYYVKCGGGAATVERFISVGGPLNGSRRACAARLLPGPGLVSIKQLCIASDLIQEIREAPPPSGVRMFSVGTRGDVITRRRHWQAEGLEPVETAYGLAPFGHWCLFFHPGNHKVVAELLRDG